MQIRLIESEAEFRALEPSWNALATACAARPYQEFGWAAAWMETFGAAGGYRPRVVTLWSGPELRALMAVAFRRYKGVRMLEWMGARVTDYCDILVDPRINRRRAAELLWSALKRRGHFDILRLGQVRADAAANEIFHGVRAWIETVEDSCSLPLTWRSGEDWLVHLAKRERGHVRRHLRRMASAGFRFHVWQSPEPYEPLVEAVIEQKVTWLRARKLDNYLLDPEGRAFVRALAAALARRGALHLSAARTNDRIGACHLGFVCHGTFYGYALAYDLEWSQYGLGTALRECLLMWACDQGLQRFDMARGTQDYKMHYNAAPAWLCTRVVGRGLVGNAALSVYRLSKAYSRKASGAPRAIEDKPQVATPPEARAV
ncbi:MAG: GNAT family N-acetyltransferase [Steroidobacteraceae bacterium]